MAWYRSASSAGGQRTPPARRGGSQGQCIGPSTSDRGGHGRMAAHEGDTSDRRMIEADKAVAKRGTRPVSGAARRRDGSGRSDLPGGGGRTSSAEPLHARRICAAAPSPDSPLPCGQQGLLPPRGKSDEVCSISRARQTGSGWDGLVPAKTRAVKK